MNCYRYKIIAFDEEKGDNEEFVGLTFANSLSGAVQRLSDYYGEYNLEGINLLETFGYDTEVMEVTDEGVLNKLKGVYNQT